LVSVAAKDLGTGKAQTVMVHPTSGLSEAEINAFIAESESSRELDQTKKEWAELRNGADTLIYGTARTLAEFGAQLAKDDKARLSSALEECKRVFEVMVSDIPKGREALAKLETEAHLLFAALQSYVAPETPPDGS
jgi:molecular chaperone DnaK